jgi:hypothetical protein
MNRRGFFGFVGRMLGSAVIAKIAPLPKFAVEYPVIDLRDCVKEGLFTPVSFKAMAWDLRSCCTCDTRGPSRCLGSFDLHNKIFREANP